jgi:hypothetical protein
MLDALAEKKTAGTQKERPEEDDQSPSEWIVASSAIGAFWLLRHDYDNNDHQDTSAELIFRVTSNTYFARALGVRCLSFLVLIKLLSGRMPPIAASTSITTSQGARQSQNECARDASSQ